MAFPSPAQMEELGKLVEQQGLLLKGKWYTVAGMMGSLERARGTIATTVVGSGVKTGVGVATGISTGTFVGTQTAVLGTTVPLGVTFIPFAAVLAPWIAAADIVRQSGDVFALHDLRDHARRGRDSAGLNYYCKCTKCVAYLQYCVDKRETRIARKAVHAFTFGVTAVLYAPWSIGKSLQSNRPKEVNCKGLLEAARRGCTVAIAAIFVIAGNWSSLRGGNEGVMRRAISILTAEDGWKILKSEL